MTMQLTVPQQWLSHPRVYENRCAVSSGSRNRDATSVTLSDRFSIRHVAILRLSRRSGRHLCESPRGNR